MARLIKIIGSPETSNYNYAGIELPSQVVSDQVLSSQESLTAVFGMGTGVTSPLKAPTMKFGDPYQTRTGDAAVRGRSLNRLTNRPYLVHLQGLEPWTH